MGFFQNIFSKLNKVQDLLEKHRENFSNIDKSKVTQFYYQVFDSKLDELVNDKFVTFSEAEKFVLNYYDNDPSFSKYMCLGFMNESGEFIEFDRYEPDKVGMIRVCIGDGEINEEKQIDRQTGLDLLKCFWLACK